MSKASKSRRLRQLKRRVGKQPEYFIIFFTVHDTYLTAFGRNKRFGRVKRWCKDIESDLISRDFIKQADMPIWINSKATMSDLCEVGNLKVRLTPKYPGQIR